MKSKFLLSLIAISFTAGCACPCKKNPTNEVPVSQATKEEIKSTPAKKPAKKLKTN